MSDQDSFDSTSINSFFNYEGVNPSQTGKTPKHSEFERQSILHRLSRFPDRFNAKPKLPSTEDPNDPTPFATNYFKTNPGAVDLSSPEEKLEELTKQLADNPSMPTSERFTALSQQKTMRYLLYGDDSIEMLRSYAAFGMFYNENNRPESAIRNLENAQKLEKTHPIDKRDSFLIALELSEAHLSIKNSQAKHVSQADAALQPFEDYVNQENNEEETQNEGQIDDQMKIRYKLAIARILAGKKNYVEAKEKFEEALSKYDQSHQDEALARLYVEIADTCDNADDKEGAQQYYEKALNIFQGLKLDEMAELVDQKIDDIKSQIQMGQKVDDDQAAQTESRAPRRKRK